MYIVYFGKKKHHNLKKIFLVSIKAKTEIHIRFLLFILEIGKEMHHENKRTHISCLHLIQSN